VPFVDSEAVCSPRPAVWQEPVFMAPPWPPIRLPSALPDERCCRRAAGLVALGHQPALGRGRDHHEAGQRVQHGRRQPREVRVERGADRVHGSRAAMAVDAAAVAGPAMGLPVIGRRSRPHVHRCLAFGALDDAGVVGGEAGKAENRRRGNRRGHETAAGLGIIRGGLENIAQEVGGRQVVVPPDADPVGRPVGGAQAATELAHGRLIDGGGEASGGEGLQDPGVARPGQTDIPPGRRCDLGGDDVATEARGAPVEHADEAGRLMVRRGGHTAGAAPLVVDGEKVGPRPLQPARNGIDLGQMGVARFHQPAPGHRVAHPQQGLRDVAGS